MCQDAKDMVLRHYRDEQRIRSQSEFIHLKIIIEMNPNNRNLPWV